MKRFLPLIGGLIGFYVLMFLWGIAWESDIVVIILGLIFGPIIYGIIIIGIILAIGYLKDKSFTLVTGIANPDPLVLFLKEQGFSFTHKKYADHHRFSASEISELKQEELIITTEKDYMRLQGSLGKYALYYLPIKTIILNKQESFFKQTILEAIAFMKG